MEQRGIPRGRGERKERKGGGGVGIIPPLGRRLEIYEREEIWKKRNEINKNRRLNEGLGGGGVFRCHSLFLKKIN